MHDVLLGSSLIAALLGGMVALFAPCCISVMLPAYFATSFGRRRALVSMTFVFAAGIAAIIIPIALGASAVSRLVLAQHTAFFLVGGVLTAALGVATLSGWRPRLPMPGMRAGGGRGPVAVFALGAFSGVSSACCAPVLAGVVALSGVVDSFAASMAIAVTYVFGMVLPLFLIALLWDRYDWGNSSLLSGRSISVRFLGTARIQMSTLISGLLLVGMGVLITVIAFTGPAMSPDGWSARVSAQMEHWASQATSAASRLPGWVIGAALATLLVALAWKAIGQAAAGERPDGGPLGDQRWEDDTGGEAHDAQPVRAAVVTPAEGGAR